MWVRVLEFPVLYFQHGFSLARRIDRIQRGASAGNALNSVLLDQASDLDCCRAISEDRDYTRAALLLAYA